MNTTKAIYQDRINRVINYINDHLDESVSLDELAGVACFSSFHFHRIFVAVTGETVNGFTGRLRVEKAARMLKYSKKSVTGVALECGFSSPAVFSRSFRQYFGTTPSDYKRTGKIGNSKICKALYPINQHIADIPVEELKNRFPVMIKTFPQRRVAFIRVVDSYEDGVVLNAFERLVTWARAVGIFDSETIFGMSLDDPMVTPKEKYRYEVCITLPPNFKVGLHPEISEMTLPKCQYAVARVSGDIGIVATVTNYLFGDWLINSGYEPEHLHGIEIFLENEDVCNWNHFDLDLCVPVKRLRNHFEKNK